MLKIAFYQTSSAHYDQQNNRYLTDGFYQVMTGFRNREMVVSMSNNGLSTRVELNGEITQYHSNTYPLQDMDPSLLSCKRM